MHSNWTLLIGIGMFYLVPSLMILIGIVSIFFPRLAWYLRVGWQIRGAEPTALVLIATRIGGLMACLFGAAFLFVVTQMISTSGGPAAPPPIPAAPAPPA